MRYGLLHLIFLLVTWTFLTPVSHAQESLVAAGQYHTCALSNGGQVSCWGRGSEGQLGNGNLSEQVYPVPVFGINNALQVVAGSQHTCVLLNDNTVKCWGSGASGELGNQSTEYRSAPVSVVDLNFVTQITAGRSHNCALLNNRSVKCWGYNQYGQLGNYMVLNENEPVLVDGLRDVIQVAAGTYHSCALISDGTVQCWGRGNSGQLGFEIIENKPEQFTPEEISDLTSVIQIGAGEFHTCALLQNGTIKCWGQNQHGQLGDGTSFARTPPNLVLDIDNAKQITVGMNHNCALLEDRTVKCWGAGLKGQLGTGIVGNQNKPTTVIELSEVAAVSANGLHTCAILKNESVRCWGQGFYNQLGNGDSTEDQLKPVAVKGELCCIEDIDVAPQISAGGAHTCVLDHGGFVWCWGDGYYGKLGNGLTDDQSHPVLAQNASASIQISSGIQHTCSTIYDGTAKCWGWGKFGQLGDGDQQDRNTPVSVVGVTSVKQIELGSWHTCALIQDGTVKCWGSGGSGQLGNGKTADSKVRVHVQGIDNAIQIASKSSHTCALLDDGTVKCWGQGQSGQLGYGGKERQPSPVFVAELGNVIQISVGANHSCALINDGTVRCWGEGTFGALGVGDWDERVTPSLIPNITTATQIASGNHHTCAVLENSNMMCWGKGTEGQLGNGETQNKNLPTLVSQIDSVSHISAGTSHTCALTQNKTIKCWGSKEDGRLGNGLTIQQSSPASVKNLKNVTHVFAGYYHSCAVTENGIAHCWGKGDSGQLGNERNDDYDTPQQVVSLGDAVQISAGVDHSCALHKNGEVSCWGDNSESQLGISNANSSSIPIKIRSIDSITQISSGIFHTCALSTTERISCWGRMSYGVWGSDKVENAIHFSAGSHHTCAALKNGTVQCWGRNNLGQIGDGTTIDKSSPVEVADILSATQISAGAGHSCALLATGQIKCWGSGGVGQLGNNNNTNQTSPVFVSGVSTAIQVATGGAFSCALLENKSVKCWGAGSYGQLGNGALDNHDLPVFVQGIDNAVQISAGNVHACALLENDSVQCWGELGRGKLGNGVSNFVSTPMVIEDIDLTTPPTISIIGNQSINENTSTGELPFTVKNPEGDADQLVIEFKSDNETLIPLENMTLGGSGKERTLVITPAIGQIGTSNITMIVSNETHSTSTSFLVTVNHVNVPPQLEDQTFSVSQNASTDLTIKVTDEDGPGDIRFSMLTDPSYGELQIIGTRLTYTPNPNFEGQDTFTLEAKDELEASSGSALITITVGNPSLSLDLPEFLLGDGGLTLNPQIFLGDSPINAAGEWHFSSQEESQATVSDTGEVTFQGRQGTAIAVTYTKGETSLAKTVYVFPKVSQDDQFEKEPNGSSTSANLLLDETPMTGAISTVTDVDYFHFHLEQDQQIQIFFANPSNNADYKIELFSKSGGSLLVSSALEGNSLHKEGIQLVQGNYSLSISAGETHSVELYTVVVLYDETTFDICEFNHEVADACLLEFGKSLTGRFLYGTNSNYYHIPIEQPRTFEVSLSTSLPSEDYQLTLLSDGILTEHSSFVGFDKGLPIGFEGDWALIEASTENTVLQSQAFSQVCAPNEQKIGFELGVPDGVTGNWARDEDSATPDGKWAMRSNNHIGDGQTSRLAIEAETSDTISFKFRVSSEPFDQLVFYVDDVKINSWANEQWTSFEHNLEPGIHQLRWEYQKDGSVSQFEDAAWIDEINLGTVNTCTYRSSTFEVNTTVENEITFQYRKVGTDWEQAMEFYVDGELQATFCKNTLCESWSTYTISLPRGPHQFHWVVPGKDSETVFQVDNFGKLVDRNQMFHKSVSLSSQELSKTHLALQPGHYYLRLDAETGGAQNLYELALSPLNEVREFEPNNTFLHPNTLVKGKSVLGRLDNEFDEDFYIFNQTQEGLFRLQLLPDSENVEIQLNLFKSDRKTAQDLSWDSENALVRLDPGVYYLRLRLLPNSTYSQNFGYTLTVASNIVPVEQLLSLTIQAEADSQIGKSVKLSVTGHYLDGSTQDLTDKVEWILSNNQASINESNELTITEKGTITVKASYQNILGSQVFQVGEGQATQTYGNLILVAGGGTSSRNYLRHATPFLTNYAYQKTLGRGFEDGDIFYLNPRDQDIDGNGFLDNVVDSKQMAVDTLKTAITEWAVDQDSSGPLYLYLNDHGGINHFEMYPGELLSAQQLDAFLDTFQAQTENQRPVIIVIEACKSGSFIDDLQGNNRLIITSSDEADSYLSIDGALSFSLPFWNALWAGATFQEAFDYALEKLDSFGRPYNKQKPQLDGTKALTSLRLGGNFGPAGPFPTIVDFTSDMSVDARDPFYMSLKLSGLEQAVEATFTIIPPNYIPPPLSADFQSPPVALEGGALDVVAFDKNTSEAIYKGSYNFTLNGRHQVIYTIRDQFHNVESSPPVFIDVTGGRDPMEEETDLTWKLISFPIDTTISPNDFFDQSTTDALNSVWHWQENTWHVWTPTGTKDQQTITVGGVEFEVLQQLEPSAGYWIHSSATFNLPGERPSTIHHNLRKGWNLVSFGTTQEYSIVKFMENYPDASAIWTWTNQQWHAHFRDFQDPEFLPFHQIQSGKGYWISIK